jgi:hypothetical protein
MVLASTATLKNGKVARILWKFQYLSYHRCKLKNIIVVFNTMVLASTATLKNGKIERIL